MPRTPIQSANRRSGRRLPWVALFSAVAVLVTGVAVAVTATNGSSAPAKLPASAPHFTITSPTPGPVLTLGIPNGLPLTFHNANSIPLTVTSLTVSLAAPIPTGCDGSNLTLNGSALSSPVTVPQSVLVAAHGSASSAQTLELIDKSAVNQDACKSQQLHFAYSGSAKYTDTTHTVLTAKPNPSKHGQSVTLRATVTSTYKDPHQPGGVVAFFRCANAACTKSHKIGSRSFTGGSVTLKTTVLPIGTSRLFAVYSGSGTNFVGSTSAKISHKVLKAGYHKPGSCIIISGAKPTQVVNTTHHGSITVKSGKVLLLDGGTITGNVKVRSGGRFLGRAGTVNGKVISRGGLVLDHVTIKGGVQVLGGGRVCLSHGKVSNNLLVSHTSHHARPTRICGETVTGSLLFIANGAVSRAGGTAHCMGNRMTGRLVVKNNIGRVRIGGLAPGRGNLASAGISVTGNHDSGLLRNNHTAGSCVLSGNVPPIHGRGNTASASNTCNRNG